MQKNFQTNKLQAKDLSSTTILKRFVCSDKWQKLSGTTICKTWKVWTNDPQQQLAKQSCIICKRNAEKDCKNRKNDTKH